MKKTITFSLIAGAFLFSGCAMTGNSISVKEAKANGGVREYIVGNNYKVFADKNDKTLFLSTNVSAGNPPELKVNDVLSVRDNLKKYCEGIGGKWEDGTRYFMLAKYDYLRNFTLANKSPKINGLGECNIPNGNGFKVKELGLFSFNYDWKIANGLGGGDRVSWSRYYEIEYNTPSKPKKDYVLFSFRKFLDKTGYRNIKKVVKDYQGLYNTGKDSYYILTTYPICKSAGGKEYIATDIGTNMKKMRMEDYLFERYEYLYEKYNNKDEKIGSQYRMFPVDKKGYIWCENPNNPKNEFMLIWEDNQNKFKIINHINKNLINNLKENNSYMQKNNDEVINIKSKKTMDDKNAYNIARSMFTIKGDVNIANNPYVQYYGMYIGKIGNCEYVSVEKKSKDLDKVYNFKHCHSEVKYTGQTLKGLAPVEYERFKPYLEGLKRSCETDGVALMQVNGYNLYCRSNKNGGHKIYILNDKFQYRDTLR